MPKVAAPPKPRRNIMTPGSLDDDDEHFTDDEYVPSSPRRYRESNESHERISSKPTTKTSPSILEDEPETIIGKAVKLNGELSFDRLLRIDGSFEGKLVSKGSLIVGPRGSLMGNIEGMRELVIDGGRVVGNIAVKKLTIRSKGEVHGDITANVMKIDPGCIIMGKINVNPYAPKLMNLKGEAVDAPKEAAPTPAQPKAAPTPAQPDAVPEPTTS